MTQWRMQAHPDGDSVDGVGFFAGVGGRFITSATEAEIQAKSYTAFEFSDLRMLMAGFAGTPAPVISFRDDGVSSSNVTVSPTADGWIEDVTGSETVAADSLISIFADNVGAMHGDNFTITALLLSYEDASTNAPVMISGSDSPLGTAYFPLQNGLGQTTDEDQAKVRIKRSQTASNLRIVCVGGSPSGDFSLRIDGSSSSNLTISISAAGAFEDVTGSDAVAADDDVNFGWILGSGDSTIHVVQVDLDTIDAFWGTINESWSATQYQPFSGGPGVASPDDNYTAHCGSVAAANLQTYVTAVSSTNVVRLRINTTNSTNLQISLTTTGLLEDVVGSEAIADTDSVILQQTSAGSASVSRVAVELPFTSVEAGLRHWQHQRSYPRGVMRGVLRGAIR